MSDRSKNILAAAALIGMAAIASSRTLTAPSAPSQPTVVATIASQPAATGGLMMASVER